MYRSVLAKVNFETQSYKTVTLYDGFVLNECLGSEEVREGVYTSEEAGEVVVTFKNTAMFGTAVVAYRAESI